MCKMRVNQEVLHATGEEGSKVTALYRKDWIQDNLDGAPVVNKCSRCASHIQEREKRD